MTRVPSCPRSGEGRSLATGAEGTRHDDRVPGLRALRFLLPFLLLLVLPGNGFASTVQAIRHSTSEGKTRVVLDLDDSSPYTHRALSNPPRIVIEIPGGVFARGVGEKNLGNGYVEKIRLNTLQSGKVQVVLDLTRGLDYSIFALDNPDRIVVDVKHAGSPQPKNATPPPRTTNTPSGGGSAKKAPPPPPPPRTPVAAVPPPRGDWVVAIDAGHGGQDNGASYHGAKEKDIALALAREVQAELDKRPGVQAFLVRKGDYYIPLRRRWTLAEKQGADLFVSIHCNASRDQKGKGTEVFFLSLKGASDEQARELAEFENSVDEKMGVEVAGDDLNGILQDMVQADVLAKSQMLAEICLDNLYELGTVYNRGVKQAGFGMLKSPRMPSVLVEAAFISNKDENKLLRDPRWQRAFGRELADGIVAYTQSVGASEKVELH